MDSKATLEFLEALSAKALETKDVGLLNHIGGNPALSHYFSNVHTIKSVTPQWWSENYPQFMVEANRLRERYEQDQAATGYGKRLDTLESKIDKLLDAVTPLIEGKTADPKKGKALKENEPVPPATKPTPPSPVVPPTPTPPPATEPPPAPEDDDDDDGDDADGDDAKGAKKEA